MGTPYLFRSTVGFCERLVAADSIDGLLHRECERLFPDEMFADLFRCGAPFGSADDRGGGDGAAADRGLQ